jgi:hypothetical protein
MSSECKEQGCAVVKAKVEVSWKRVRWSMVMVRRSEQDTENARVSKDAAKEGQSIDVMWS